MNSCSAILQTNSQSIGVIQELKKGQLSSSILQQNILQLFEIKKLKKDNIHQKRFYNIHGFLYFELIYVMEQLQPTVRPSESF